MTNQFDWLSYLEVAELLVRQRGQGFSRSAISRAYYGVLNHIRDTLQPLRSTPFPRTGLLHQEVINTLKTDPRSQVAELGENLDRLHKERNRADYQTRTPFPASRARGALAEARRIREGIAAFFPNS